MRRKVGVFLIVGLVLPLAITANAGAQGSTLGLTPSTAAPGTEIFVTGTSFSSGTGVSPVFIRLNSRTATSLREITPTGGNISSSFFLPSDLAPGRYLVLATQTTAGGRQAAFTPGRGNLLVTGAAFKGASGGAPPGGSGLPLTITGAMLGLILLTAGACAVRRFRTPSRAQLGS
jgi:hypothetical protein